MTNTTYEDLNAEIFLLDSDGNIQFEKDKEATRAYFLEEVNRRTRFFYTLKEKVNYLLDNELWKRETVEMFSFDQFKALFKQAHEHKARFESFMGARKFFTQYALADMDGNTFVERFEDRVVLTAIDLSGGDYDAAKDLVDAIITGRFQPATPTFLNAGRAQGGERVSCFGEGTNVSTFHGSTRIEDISVGELVYGHDGNLHQVSAVNEHYAESTVELDITGHPSMIVTTEEHPFLASDGDQSKHSGDGESANLHWVTAGSLAPGSYVADSVEDYTEFYVPSIDTKAYALEAWGVVAEKDGKYYRATTCKKNNRKKGHNLDLSRQPVAASIDMNYEFGYLVGLFLAEGYVHYTGEQLKGLRYTFNSTDSETISRTAELIRDVLGVEPVTNVNKDDSTNVSAWSGVIGAMFEELLGNGFDKKRIPPFMLGASEDFRRGLAVGVFRGDGCMFANGNTMDLSNPALVRDIRNVLHSIGVLSYLRDHVTRSGRDASILSVPRCNEANDQFLKAIGRNYEKITASYSGMFAHWIDGRPCYRVRANHSGDSAVVYNLQVEDAHTYVAEGVHVHNCFLLRVEDNTESITRCFTSAAQLSRRGGGVGINASNLRESGATIQKTPNASKGLIPFMKVLEDEFKYFDQLGQRQGAGVVYVNAHHPDIMRVLDTKRENADEAVRLKTLSIGVVIPDITFDLAKRNADMYLFSPSDVEKVEGKAFADLSVTDNYDRWVEDERITKSKVNARQFFQTLSELQFESGYPYILFEDEANRTHTLSEVGRVQMSNLCSEILQVQSPGKFNADCSYLDEGADISCNLGSFNIDKMWSLNKEEFIDTVIAATKALDQVSRTTSIESVPSVRKGNELSHSIGLGQMNLHGALGVRRIFYDSDEARSMFSKHMALTTFSAMLASTQLAREYGTHAYYDQSEYADGSWFRRVVDPWIEEYGDDLEIVDGLSAPTADEWKQLELEVAKYGLANAYLQAVPPTGSISYINHSTSSIHPVAAPIEIRKEGKTGRTYYPAPGMNNDNLEYFQSAAEIGPEATILMYEKGQYWVDQGMSLTLFFPDKVSDAKTGELRATTTRDINRAQIFAWRHHIKTLYYVRIVQAAMDGTQVDGTAMGLIREVQSEACTSCQL